MKTKVILVDDEPKALGMLFNKIRDYCPNLEVIAQISNPIEAKGLIEEMKPDLIFLDVAMPEIDGFELLESFVKPNFEVIFATAYDQYAVDAIKKCAIGYLLKPIEPEDLVQAVNNALISIEKKYAFNKNKEFVDNLKKPSFLDHKIVVPLSEGIIFFEIKDLIRIEGYEGYSKVYSVNQPPLVSSYNIGFFKDNLEGENFYATHKSHLLNLYHIKKITIENMVIMTDDSAVPISKRRKKDFNDFIKKAIKKNN